MIIFAEIIDQPSSGEYDEKIYDHQSPWNSQTWTYIKFTNADHDEWCGVFRGQGRDVALAAHQQEVIVLTSDYAWRLRQQDGTVLELEDRPSYRNLTIAPSGEIVISDYYHIWRINGTLKTLIPIPSPVQMDLIQFKNWSGNVLRIACDEFMSGRHLELELDAASWKIELKSDLQ
ncbi:MAG: hypothetical protein AB8F95_00075 [Bacteroidia bacterium]